MLWISPSECGFGPGNVLLTTVQVRDMQLTAIFYRFAINDGMDWSSAEKQVQKLVHKDGKGKGGVSSIISVKGTAALKRKADSIGEDDEKSPKDKKTRRGGKKVKH